MWSKLNKVAIAIFVVLFTIFGIQSSYADYYPSGIQQNVSEQTLIDNGWTKFYEQTYGTITATTAPLRPSEQYVILAGKAVGSSTIILAAAAPTSAVFTVTVLNTPQLLNGTYWYNTPSNSIGFAPTATISQNIADQQDTSSVLRLSWHLNNTQGGWRLGSLTELNYETAYLKQVWTWNGVSTTPAPASAPAPAPVYVRQTSNLTFAQSLYASDTLSDPDGELRKTVDQIMEKYGSLIK
jgi:hypothetical protein